MFLRVDRVSQHAFLASPLSAESVVFDLGANNGEFCLDIARKYGCRVFAAEPVPKLAKDLQNRDKRVVVHSVAIGGRTGTATIVFDVGKDKTGSLLGLNVVGGILHDPDTRELREVRVQSLEEFLDHSGSGTVDLLKLDIEGAELDALSEAPDSVLARCKQITVEFHDFWYPELKPKTEQVKRKLIHAGFDMIRFTPNNKDVLFINRRLLPMSALETLLLRHIIRNVMGFGRMWRLYRRRIFGRR